MLMNGWGRRSCELLLILVLWVFSGSFLACFLLWLVYLGFLPFGLRTVPTRISSSCCTQLTVHHRILTDAHLYVACSSRVCAVIALGEGRRSAHSSYGMFLQLCGKSCTVANCPREQKSSSKSGVGLLCVTTLALIPSGCETYERILSESAGVCFTFLSHGL